MDQELKTEWTIYPFAWELKPGAKPIKFDWEHTEVKFVKPIDLDKYDHVPQLEVGMFRVLVSDETERGLQELREDHVSGARVLAVKALEIMLNSVQKGDLRKLDRTEDFWRELRWMAWHLGKNGRPSMAAAIEYQLFRALDAVRTKMSAAEQSNGTLSINEATKIATECIQARIAAQKHSLEKLSGYFVDFIESRTPVQEKADPAPPVYIVALSSSGTIVQCLVNLISVLATKEFSISLSVLESRPNFEGISFVNTLLSSLSPDPDIINKLEIKVVSDASVATVTRNADYLILGGDKVLQDGAVSNKIGSLATAIVAKTVNPKCNVIATFETSKITVSSFEGNHVSVEYNDESEMISAWPKDELEKLREKRKLNFKVEIKNAYFEWVSPKWIDTYISEEGVLGVQDIERIGKQSKELEDKLFDDL